MLNIQIIFRNVTTRRDFALDWRWKRESGIKYGFILILCDEIFFFFGGGGLGKSQTEESHDQHIFAYLCHLLLPVFLLLYLFHMQTELCVLSRPFCLIFLSAHYNDFIPHNRLSTTFFQAHYRCFLKCPTKTFPQWIVFNFILSVGLNLTYLITFEQQ